jgi:hypothetical protein
MPGEEGDAVQGSPMWKGSSERLELGDHLDFGRTDLFAAFEADPLARHDLELQLLVSGVRGSGRIPRMVLARVAPGRWQVIRIAAERGGAPELVSPRVFDDLRDAERYVFGLRLQLLGALDAAASVGAGGGGPG